jgi:hypothetical protein
VLLFGVPADLPGGPVHDDPRNSDAWRRSERRRAVLRTCPAHSEEARLLTQLAEGVAGTQRDLPS